MPSPSVQAEPAVPTEAPAGFNTPSFNGAHSINNGLIEPPGDSFALDQQIYEQNKTVALGLGPVYKAPIFEAPGQTRVGRFGWKDQHSSLLSFIADAYLNEMGITSRLRPNEVTNVLLTTTGTNDVPDALGMEDIDHFAQFVRGTMVPPRDTALAATAPAIKGQALFTQTGCSVCHVQTIVTAPAGTIVNGNTFTIPAALGNKIIHPFSDFLLHDIGTGDGIVQVGPQDTANKLRTAPLWGLRDKARFMHDLASLSLDDAIDRHEGEAHEPARHFRELSHEIPAYPLVLIA
jgi:CxxC motif-containing protein (DUF1111 family)